MNHSAEAEHKKQNIFQRALGGGSGDKSNQSSSNKMKVWHEISPARLTLGLRRESENLRRHDSSSNFYIAAPFPSENCRREWHFVKSKFF
jgi:hypothetical protein